MWHEPQPAHPPRLGRRLEPPRTRTPSSGQSGAPSSVSSESDEYPRIYNFDDWTPGMLDGLHAGQRADACRPLLGAHLPEDTTMTTKMVMASGITLEASLTGASRHSTCCAALETPPATGVGADNAPAPHHQPGNGMLMWAMRHWKEVVAAGS